MARAIVLCYKDVDQGAGANDLVLYAEVAYVGTGVPNSPVIADRVAINIAINNLAGYPNAVEDALLAKGTELGVTGLVRTDCLFPNYVRGA